MRANKEAGRFVTGTPSSRASQHRAEAPRPRARAERRGRSLCLGLPFYARVCLVSLGRRSPPYPIAVGTPHVMDTHGTWTWDTHTHAPRTRRPRLLSRYHARRNLHTCESPPGPVVTHDQHVGGERRVGGGFGERPRARNRPAAHARRHLRVAALPPPPTRPFVGADAAQLVAEPAHRRGGVCGGAATRAARPEHLPPRDEAKRCKPTLATCRQRRAAAGRADPPTCTPCAA